MAQDADQATDGQAPADADQQDAQATDDGQQGEPRSYDENYVRKLRREAAAHRTRVGELETRVQQFEDAQKTEAERTAERMQEAERRAAEAEMRLMRFDVAAAKGLDAKFADLLTGSDREQMEANADRLLELAAVKATPPAATAADFDGGARKDAVPADMDQFIRAGSRR